MTVSELAVLRAVEQGARTCEEVAGKTGAALWWVEMNAQELAKAGRLGYDHVGLVIRAH